MNLPIVSDASKYEILYDLPEGEYSEGQVGGIRTKTIRAGDSLEVEAFPLLHIPQAAKMERRKRGTTPAQEKLNLKNARKRVRRLLETNFTNVDYVLHLTFDYGFIDRAFSNLNEVRREMEQQGYPMDDEDARRIIRNFIQRLKRLIKRKGGDAKKLKYMYVIETTKEPRDEDQNPLPARYHYHMVISSLGVIDVEDINTLWDYGYTKTQMLDFRFNGLEGLSTYITKQRRFARRYAHSRNLKEPDIRVSDRKISRRRAALMAGDIQANGREILEKIYPGYVLEDCSVKYSDFIAGAYIYARMRRRDPGGGNKRKGGGSYGTDEDKTIQECRNRQEQILRAEIHSIAVRHNDRRRKEAAPGRDRPRGGRQSDMEAAGSDGQCGDLHCNEKQCPEDTGN